jgi:tetratricopeptide (TPR) repeat protein
MQNVRSLRRSLLLALSLLSAGAASEALSSSAVRANPLLARPAGGYGAYLAGRFAQSQNDLGYAATELLAAHRADPANAELLMQAFLGCLLDARAEAVSLAAQLPDSPIAQLLLADQDAAAGRWDAAERRYRNLKREGLTQLVQPLLIAWAQQGAGRTDAALATLHPLLEGQRFRGIYALHAGLIADLAGRSADAARNYRIAQADFGGTNLRLAQILASWEARQGNASEAKRVIESMRQGSRELGIAVPALAARIDERPVANASDGIAEAYLALAASLRQQESSEFPLLLLRLALNLRPDLTAVRLLTADVLDLAKHPAQALAALAPIPESDPLYSLVQLRRAGLQQQAGNTEAATRTLERLAQDMPDRPEPLTQLGDILRAKSRFAEAVAAYDRAIERISQPTSGDWPLFYARGIAHDRAHHWDQAEADLEHALRLSPNEAYVLNYLGYSLTEQGRNLARAKQMIEKAAELRPNDGAIVDSLGWVLMRQGDSAAAVRWLERAVELEPEDPTINSHLGDAYWSIGRKLQAEFQWRRALNLNPEPSDAAKLEAKLREAAPGPVASPATAAARQVQ